MKNQIYPRPHDKQTVYLKDVITGPNVIDPKTTSSAEAYELWMNAPNPMVTFFKTLDVTPLYRLSRRRKLKFNMFLLVHRQGGKRCQRVLYTPRRA